MISRSIRESVELAVAVTLAQRLPYFKKGALLPYNGELTSKEGLELVRRALGGRSPGAMILTGDSSFTAESTRRTEYTEKLSVALIVCATNYRSRVAQVHGDPHDVASEDPGIYRVTEDILKHLGGLDLGIETVGVLEPRKLGVLHQEPSFCAWLMDFDVDIDRRYERHEERYAPSLDEINGWLDVVGGDEVILTGGGMALTRTLTAAAGVVTLADPAATFSSQLVGCRIEITGALAYDNNGDFEIASVPTSTSLTFAHVRGASENPYVGTYVIKNPRTAKLQS